MDINFEKAVERADAALWKSGDGSTPMLRGIGYALLALALAVRENAPGQGTKQEENKTSP